MFAFFSPSGLATEILWPVGLVVEITFTKTLDGGLPFVSMVMPLMIPFSVALAPAVNSPVASVADPRVSYGFFSFGVSYSASFFQVVVFLSFVSWRAFYPSGVYSVASYDYSTSVSAVFFMSGSPTVCAGRCPLFSFDSIVTFFASALFVFGNVFYRGVFGLERDGTPAGGVTFLLFFVG